MRTTASDVRPDLDPQPAPVSRTRRLLGVLAATAVLMGTTGVGLVAVQHAAAHTTAVTAAEAVAPSGAHPPAALDTTPLPSVKRILATAEGSGAEREHSKADHRQDRRTGELDN